MGATTFARCAAGRGVDRDELDLFAPFRRAIAEGADGIEARARLSADGKLVLAEEESYRRSLRQRSVAGTSASQLSAAGIPSLADLHLAIAGAGELCLEVADEPTARAVLAEVGSIDRGGRLWLRSPDRDMLFKIRAAAPGVRLVHDLARRAYGDTLERHLADLAGGSLDGLSMRAGEWSLGLTSLVHRFGLLAYGSQAREERHLRNLVAASVDAIASTAVDRLVAIVSSPPARPGAPSTPQSG
ncbi:MAG: glycerophosphodiester phosphodiesterase [Acidimicrobiia bacterium]